MTMKNKLIILLVLFFAIGMSGVAQEFTVIPEKSILRWTGKKVGKDHTGTLSLKEGSFTIRDGKIVGGNFVIDMKSIVNDDVTDREMNAKLVGHLKSADFFNVEAFPTATLKLHESLPTNSNEATVTGDLTIKGITHPVTFTVKRTGMVFQSVVTFDRSLYNVRFASGKFFENLGDNAIEDQIPLSVTLVTKQR